MSRFTPQELLTIAGAIALAYPNAGRATQLFASINESFDALTDPQADHSTRIADAVADLMGRGRLPALLIAARDDPQQAGNAALRNTVQCFIPQARWQALGMEGFVMRLGPFVDRHNLRDAIKKLFVTRRVIRVLGTTGARGKSWSCQLLEREAEYRGAFYIKFDLREVPVEARESPLLLATQLHETLGRNTQELAGYAETRLVEPLLAKWAPPDRQILVVLDHLGDSNVKEPVREYVIALANAVAEGRLLGIRLVLIDGPPGLDLSKHTMHAADDVVGLVTVDHVAEFFRGAVSKLFPGLADPQVEGLVQAVITPLSGKLPSSASEELAIALRDALEELTFA